jgi:alpha-mannosidase
LRLHDGVADLAEVHRAAERFNNPVAVLGSVVPTSGQGISGAFSLATVDVANVTIETVKKAERSDALVFRVFEHANTRADARIRFGLPVKSVRRTNLMEETDEGILAVTDNEVVLSLRPFEIATLLVETA